MQIQDSTSPARKPHSTALATALLAGALLSACQTSGAEPPSATASTEAAELSQLSTAQLKELVDRAVNEKLERLGLQLEGDAVVQAPLAKLPHGWFFDPQPFVKGPTGGWATTTAQPQLQWIDNWNELVLQPEIYMPQGGQTHESVNKEAWRQHRGFIGGLPDGTWVVIAAGKLHGTFEDPEAVWESVAKLPEDATQALVYRVGIDDQSEEVVLSPMAWNSPNWTQAGRSFTRQWKLTLEAANDTWHRGTESITWGDAGARFELVGTNGQRRRVPGVISAMVQQDLTVTHDDAEALGLLRFQSPVPCTYGPEGESCPLVLVRIEVPELGLSSVAMAAVLPKP